MQLGTLATTLAACDVDVSDAWDCVWVLVGVLYFRMGRMVVLGSRRKCLFDAMACRDCVTSFCDRCRKTRVLEELVCILSNPDVCVIAYRYVYRTLRSLNLSTRVCS